jgi:hypothetical protein
LSGIKLFLYQPYHMFNMKFHLLLLNSLITLNIFAQTLTSNQESVIRDLLTSHFDDQGENTLLNVGNKAFIKIGNDTFYNVPGYHYIFKLAHDSIKRLDKSYFHGNNFNRFIFEYKRKIHLLGGYGMYSTINNLETFNLENYRWSYCSTQGEKPAYIHGLAIKKGDFIYSFYNYKSGNNSESDKFDPYIYKLNLEDYSWTKSENINHHNNLPIEAIYTKDFIIGISGNQVFLMNNNTLQYLVLGKDEFAFGHLIGKYSVNGNQIKTERGVLNVEQVWKEKHKSATLFILEPAWYQLPWIRKTIGAILSSLLLGSAFFIILKRRNKSKTNAVNLGIKETVNPLAGRILSATKQTLDIDELDMLLEIDHMEFDSRKLKRHRLLSDLEKTHPGLILRQKDETDKRRFIYVIKKG